MHPCIHIADPVKSCKICRLYSLNKRGAAKDNRLECVRVTMPVDAHQANTTPKFLHCVFRQIQRLTSEILIIDLLKIIGPEYIYFCNCDECMHPVYTCAELASHDWQEKGLLQTLIPSDQMQISLCFAKPKLSIWILPTSLISEVSSSMQSWCAMAGLLKGPCSSVDGPY